MAASESSSQVTFSIDDLVKSATAINAMTPIINSIMKAIDKVTSVKDLENKVKSINIVSKNVTAYVKGLADIAKKLTTISDASIAQLIDFNESMRDEDDSDKKSEVKILTAIKSLGSILDVSVKGIDTISKMDFGASAFIMTQLKIKMLGTNISLLFKTLLEVVKDIADSEESKELIKFLVSENPAVNKVKNIKKNDKGVIIEENESETTVKEGRTGIIDAVLGFVNVFNALNSMQMPSLVKTLVKIRILGKEFEIVMGTMAELIKCINEARDLNNVKDNLDAINDILSIFAESTMPALETIASKTKTIKAITASLGEDSVQTVLDTVSMIIQKTVDMASMFTVGDRFVEAASNFETVGKVMEELKSIALNMVIVGLIAPVAVPATLMATVLIGAIRLLMFTLYGINDELKASIESLETLSRAVLILSGALLALALTGAVLQHFGISTILLPMLAVIAFTFAITLISKLITDIKDDVNKNLLYVASAIALIGATAGLMILVGVAVLNFWKEIAAALLYVSLILALFVGLAIITKEIDMLKVVITVTLIGVAMVVLAAGLLAFTYAVSMMASVTMEQVGIALAFIGGLIVIAYLASFAMAGVMALAALGVAMIAISAGVFMLVLATKQINEIDSDALISLVTSFIGMAYLAILALPGAAALIVIGVSMILFAAGIAALVGTYKLMMSVAGDDEDWVSKIKAPLNDFIDLLKELANPLTLVAITLGTASMALMTGAAVMLTVLTLSLLGTVKMANAINTSMNDDPEFFKKRITTPLNGMIDAVNEISFLKAAMAGAIMAQLGTTFMRPISDLVDVIQKLSNMVIVYTDPSGAVKEKAIDDDVFEKASDALKTIVVKYMSIFTDDTTINAIEKISDIGTRKVKKVFIMLGEITSPISAMVDTIKSLAEGKVKVTEMVNGKQVENEYSMIDFIDRNKAKIQSNLETVISGFTTAISNAFQDESIIDRIEDAQDAGEALVPLTSSISSMIESSKKIVSEFNEGVDLSSLGSNVSTIVGAYTGLFTGPDGKDKGAILNKNMRKTLSDKQTLSAINNLGSLVKVVNTLGQAENFNVDNHTKAADNFVKLIDKANTIDTSKIKTVTEMFKEMAEFSKSISGDFEKLADVLNDKILEALNNIHDAISKPAAVAAANVVQPGESMAQSHEKEREAAAAAAEPAQQVDLSGVESALEEIISIIDSIKSNGVKSRPLFM